jgi:hypothetical protein
LLAQLESAYEGLPKSIKFYSVGPGQLRSYFVATAEGFAGCSCMLPVALGIPCSHVYAVMKRNGIFLPVESINPRWRSQAWDDKITLINKPSEAPSLTLKTKEEMRLKGASVSPADNEFLAVKAQQLSDQSQCWILLRESLSMAVKTGNERGLMSHVNEWLLDAKKQFSEADTTIQNPICVKAKGRPSTRRLKSAVEKASKVRKISGSSLPQKTKKNTKSASTKKIKA